MRISFDLDYTLICYGGDVRCEPRIALPLRLLLRDEPLRLGARHLARELRSQGHELWVYTTSSRRRLAVRCWLLAHGISVSRVINADEHDRRFGRGSSPTKRPHAFGIDLHIDDAPGVAVEGRQHGFSVCVVYRKDEAWVERILQVVANREANP